MRIFGLDFTSAPSKKKPITCVSGWFENHYLLIENTAILNSFEEFEKLLTSSGPWHMAIDFPFSLPRKWLDDMDWPTDWESYTALIRQMPLNEFIGNVVDYRTKQPKGQKYHKRQVDKLAKSCSPMMVDYTPVGRMFYEGAPRLLKSGACIPILNKVNSNRIIVEGYPALVARRFIEKQSYKSDTRKKQTVEKGLARKKIVDGLLRGELDKVYGFEIDLKSINTADLIKEPGADMLDALLCSIQAAWSHSKKDQNFGIPEDPRVQEGWMADPSLLLDEIQI